jgi:hypothetical protein
MITWLKQMLCGTKLQLVISKCLEATEMESAKMEEFF